MEAISPADEHAIVKGLTGPHGHRVSRAAIDRALNLHETERRLGPWAYTDRARHRRRVELAGKDGGVLEDVDDRAAHALVCGLTSARNAAARQRAELPADQIRGVAEAITARRHFEYGGLAGGPVAPHIESGAYARWSRTSIARVFAGAMTEHGATAGVVVPASSSPLPDLGRLDPAPAMFHALGEADYVIRSFGTPVAWHLDGNVAGVCYGMARPLTEHQWRTGDWIEVYDFGAGYGRFTRTTTRHQRIVQAALAVQPVLAGP